MWTMSLCTVLYHLLVLTAMLHVVPGWWPFEDKSTDICNPANEFHCDCPEDMASSAFEGIDCSFQNISGQLPQPLLLPVALRKIDLSRNEITALVENQFGGNGSETLEELFLCRNNISALASTGLSELWNLKRLDLSRNKITTIPDDFLSNSSLLEVLDVSFNKLTEVSSNLFSTVPHLQTLVLGFNPIGSFLSSAPDAFSELHDLKTLNLQNVSIYDVPKNLFADLTLEVLFLSDNPLVTVPTDALATVGVTLDKLDLSGTSIAQLTSNSFYNLIQLKTCVLNRIYLLEDIQEAAFADMINLDTIELENNFLLTRINKDAFGDSCRPRHVSFYQSGLHRLDSILLDWDTVEELNLQGCPWACDCDLAWMKQINISKDLRANVRCSSPPAVHNELLFAVEDTDFVCPSNSIHAAFMIVLDLAAVAGVVFASIFLFLFLWKRYNFSLCRRITTGHYFQMRQRPSKTDLEWDNKDLD